MNYFKTKIHSVIDLITNSSTEIFINCNKDTIETAKNFVNVMLEAAGSNKTADDLFEFQILNSNHIENYCEMMAQRMFGVSEKEGFYSLSDDKQDKISKMYDEAMKDPEFRPDNWCELGTGDHIYSHPSKYDSLVMIPKETTSDAMWLDAWFHNIFTLEEEWC